MILFQNSQQNTGPTEAIIKWDHPRHFQRRMTWEILLCLPGFLYVLLFFFLSFFFFLERKDLGQGGALDFPGNKSPPKIRAQHSISWVRMSHQWKKHIFFVIPSSLLLSPIISLSTGSQSTKRVQRESEKLPKFVFHFLLTKVVLA